MNKAEHTTIRSTSGIVSTIVALIVAAVLIGDLAIRGTAIQVLKYTPWMLLVVYLIYLMVGASSVRIAPQSLIVRNMLRRHTIAWRDVTDVTVRYQVFVHTNDDHSTPLMAGPAAGRPGRVAGARGEGYRPAPIMVLRDEITAAWERGKEAPDQRTTHGWDVPLVAVGSALLVVSILTTLIS